jgi:hypothetical protein
MHRIAPLVRGLFVPILLGSTVGSWAVAANVPYINGGIGRGEVKHIEAQQDAYNLRLTFSEGPKNDYVTNVVLRIADSQGRTVLALDDAGPLTQVKLAPGRYSVSTRYGDNERTQAVEVRAGAPSELNLHYQPPAK